jgi:hypothetical protein
MHKVITLIKKTQYFNYMTDSEKVEIAKIRKYLPFRYSKTLQERIIKRTGRKYAMNYIAMCLADPPVRYNVDVIHEAAIWAEEEKKRQEVTAAILDTL